MIKICLIFLVFASAVFSQTDWEKWDKKEIDYKFPVEKEREYHFDNDNVPVMMVSFLKNSYWFLFSEHDGDNCPFHPTCSQFFMNAVKETNILKGALMFADRFTRDTNIFKSTSHYPKFGNGRFFDPVKNYKLDYSKIKYYPSATIVNDDKK